MNLKNMTAMILAVCVTGTTLAQTGSGKPDSKKSEQIIIKKHGDKAEKMTIVVDGDKVTINGKPVNEFKDGSVTILDGDEAMAFGPGARSFRSQRVAPMAPARGNKAMLGVVTESVDGGAKVTDVTDESGAEKAGLKEDDIIIRVADKKIETSNDLIAAIGAYKPNDKVEITYMRDGKEAKTTATLGENKAKSYTFNMNEDFNFDFPKGMQFEGMGWNRKPKIGLQIQDLEEGKGVKVNEVDDDSPAEKAGLEEGDVLTLVNGKAVDGVDALRNEIKDIKEGDVVKMTYRRGNKTNTVDVKIPKKLKTANL